MFNLFLCYNLYNQDNEPCSRASESGGQMPTQAQIKKIKCPHCGWIRSVNVAALEDANMASCMGWATRSIRLSNRLTRCSATWRWTRPMPG